MKRNRLIALILALILTLGLSVPAMAADSDFVIRDGVLYHCHGNKDSIIIPDGVVVIDNDAFYDCRAELTSVTIPVSVQKIEYGAFAHCTSLEEVHYLGTKAQWSEIDKDRDYSSLSDVAIICSDGVVRTIILNDTGRFETERGVLVYCSWGDDGNIYIPSGITGIQDNLFSQQEILYSVTIPDSVTDIGEGTFALCENLKSVALPSGITRIGGSVFFGCSSLTDVNIPSGVTELGGYSFAFCDSLTSITIPSSVTKIGDGAFEGCSSLTGITVPSGVTKLGGLAFTFCYNLSSITIPASVSEIADLAFYGCDSLTDIYFEGTPEQWAAIRITEYNGELSDIFEELRNEATPLTTATVHFGNGSSKPGTSGGQTTQPTAGAFTDVPDGTWYTEPVKWAVGREITNGTTPTTFSPNDTCTNAHILTFLWRANGSPEVKAENTFTDVRDTDYYYKPALWAKSLGMISGTTMSPDAPCTRASTVMFMWKAAGSPSVSAKTGFTDVPADADYAMAVAWAVENGVTNGTGAGTFSPNGTCTRAEIVTFLYRAKDI